MKLKTYVSNFNGVNSNKFLCNAFIFIIYVSNSNGVNSNQSSAIPVRLFSFVFQTPTE